MHLGGNFFSKYLTECVNLGITDNVAICDRAKTRIKEIEKQLHEADALRLEKANLETFVKDFTGGTKSSRKRAVVQVPPIDLNDDSEEARLLHSQICEAIDTLGPLSNRELQQKVGSYQNDHKVFRAIKYLGDQGIIKRNKFDSKLIKGENWENRPHD